MNKAKVFCLMGPTASGKTDMALFLHSCLPCRIISVDSAMVYRDMNIGTAKPDPVLLREVPHDLIDVCDPSDAYSGGRFYQEVEQCIQTAIARHEIPLLVGGTLMYFRLLQQGCADLPMANSNIRKKIEEEARLNGWPAMHERLRLIDPVLADRLHPNDKQRIQRALEIVQVSGQKLSELQQHTQVNVSYDFINIALIPNDRSMLHACIEERMDWMLSQGLVDEVKRLYQREELHAELPSMRSVGYRQWWAYCDGKLDYDTARFKAIVATRQLAKRQLTWLRSWPNLNVFQPGEKQAVWHHFNDQLSAN